MKTKWEAFEQVSADCKQQGQNHWLWHIICEVQEGEIFK